MKIKPCPFCGGKAESMESWSAGWYVECQECGVMIRLAEDSEEEAIEVWNRRKPIDKIVEQLESEANKYRESGEDYGSVAELGVASGIMYAIDTIKGGVSNETD